MRIQFDSLRMRIETGLQRASCEHALNKFEEPVLYKIGDNRTLSQSDKMADFGTQPCLNCTVPEGEDGQDSVCSDLIILQCLHLTNKPSHRPDSDAFTSLRPLLQRDPPI